jgi:hypothetical protein
MKKMGSNFMDWTSNESEELFDGIIKKAIEYGLIRESPSGMPKRTNVTRRWKNVTSKRLTERYAHSL